MTKLPVYALALLLSAGVVSAQELSLSVNSNDPRTEVGPRHDVRDARLAITTRDGSTTLLLLKEVVAVQLTDKAFTPASKAKEEPGFLEELLAAGVRLALGKSLEYPIANIKSVEYRDGALRLTSDENKPLFTNMEVNHTDVLRNFSPADAQRFVRAFRAAKR
jgi:hypothetical protein